MDLAAWWYEYHRLGFSTIPLRSRSKTPLIEWKKYQENRATPAEIEYWRQKYKDKNIAILTGAISGIIVLDVDGEAGWQYLKENGFVPPPTPRAQTSPGKAHFYFKHPGGVVKTKVNTAIKIDIKGDGGYVVAPPSLHEKGGSYTWVAGFSPTEIPLADPPPWLLQIIAENSAGMAPAPPETPKKVAGSKSRPVKEVALESRPGVSAVVLDANLETEKKAVYDAAWEARVLSGVAEGERNDVACRLVGKWLYLAQAPAVVWAQLRNWNLQNEPPMDEAELRTIFNSVSQREAKAQAKKQDLPPTAPHSGNGKGDPRTLEEKRADMLEGLSTRYGIKFKHIEEITGDRPQYIFHLYTEERGDVELWTTFSDVMNQHIFRTKIGAATKVLPPAIKSKNGEWDGIAGRILQCAVTRPAGTEATITGELLRSIEDYCKWYSFINVDTDTEVKIEENPFIFHQQAWISLAAYRRWLMNYRVAIKLSHQEIVQRLVMAEFEESQFRLPGAKKQQKFWRIPAKYLDIWEIVEKI